MVKSARAIGAIIMTSPAASHVLIVDDDPDMRSMLAEYLEGENFTVSAVADGQAMDSALREKPVR